MEEANNGRGKQMIWALRIVFWLQLLAGIGLSRAFFGMGRGLGQPGGELMLHLILGIVGAVLAIVVLRPFPQSGANTMTMVAGLFPLIPLIIGLAMEYGGLKGMVPVAAIHSVLGVAAVALIEMAVARQRRTLRAAV